jgi:hypothetical protein
VFTERVAKYTMLIFLSAALLLTFEDPINWAFYYPAITVAFVAGVVLLYTQYVNKKKTEVNAFSG